MTRAEAAIDALFADARTKSEIDFVLALNPEFRGIQDAGWSPAEEVLRAIEDFSGFLNDGGVAIRLRVRAALGFYCNLCEASGLYEVPKNLMRILDGQKHHCWPFQDLVEQHTRTGEAILPNANKIMKNLVGHAKALGRDELATVLSEAFDAELRHAFAHADYVIWADGVRICGKHFTKKRLLPFPEFQALVNRGAGFITEKGIGVTSGHTTLAGRPAYRSRPARARGPRCRTAQPRRREHIGVTFGDKTIA